MSLEFRNVGEKRLTRTVECCILLSDFPYAVTRDERNRLSEHENLNMLLFLVPTEKNLEQKKR